MNWLTSYVIPSLSLIIPVIMVIQKRGTNSIDLSRIIVAKLVLIWLFITSAFLVLLVYLSSGLNSYWKITPSTPIIVDGSMQWNITGHLQMLMPLYLLNNFAAISILSGIIYASLLTLPAICETKGDIPSTIGSVATGFSAVGSSVVCCSTSAFAVIAPSFSLVIGPYIPGLLIFSLLLLLYSFHRSVIARLPLVDKTTLSF